MPHTKMTARKSSGGLSSQKKVKTSADLKKEKQKQVETEKNDKNLAAFKAAASSVSSFVCNTVETFSDRGSPAVTKKIYATQKEANSAVLEQWNEYKSGYSLQECSLYENAAGFLKFEMIDQEGEVTTFWSCPAVVESWNLIKTADECDEDGYNQGTDDELPSSDGEEGSDDMDEDDQ